MQFIMLRPAIMACTEHVVIKGAEGQGGNQPIPTVGFVHPLDVDLQGTFCESRGLGYGTI